MNVFIYNVLSWMVEMDLDTIVLFVNYYIAYDVQKWKYFSSHIEKKLLLHSTCMYICMTLNKMKTAGIYLDVDGLQISKLLYIFIIWRFVQLR